MRRESHLPLIDLDVDAEVDRLVKAQVQAAFERFLNGRYVSRVIRRAVSRYRSRPGSNFNSITEMMLQIVCVPADGGTLPTGPARDGPRELTLP